VLSVSDGDEGRSKGIYILANKYYKKL